jgi:transcriptional regulator with XRE-family HTH domain
VAGAASPPVDGSFMVDQSASPARPTHDDRACSLREELVHRRSLGRASAVHARQPSSPAMTDEQAGRLIAAVRRHLGLRQADVAAAAGVDGKVVSLLERGQLERVSVARFRRVCAALGIERDLTLRWRGGLGDRLIDRGHAFIVDAVLSDLRRHGWEVQPEFTFNVFGERGSVDVLAWHPGRRALLIVEVKTRLTDLGSLLMSMSRKVRLVPPLVAKDLGWDRRCLGHVVVIADTRANRATVTGHRVTFDAAFPSATAATRAWIRSPARDVAGLWFLASGRDSPVTRTLRQRVRPPHAQRTGSAAAKALLAGERRPNAENPAPGRP